MKEHVVDQEIGGAFYGSKYLDDLFGQRGMMLLRGAFSGEGGEIALNNQSHFKHLPGLKAVQHAHEAERCLAKLSRTVRDEGPHSVPHLHYAHRRQVAYPGTETGAADTQRAREFALRGNLVTWLQSAIFYERTDVVHHLHGPVRVRQVLLDPRHIEPASS